MLIWAEISEIAEYGDLAAVFNSITVEWMIDQGDVTNQDMFTGYACHELLTW